MATTLPQTLQTLAPPWPQRHPADHAGNYVAAEMKLIHDDSASVFPESVHSGEAARLSRWRSLVHSDFVPPPRLTTSEWDGRQVVKPQDSLMPSSGKHMPDKCGDCLYTSESDVYRRQILASVDDPRTMFMNWRVPARLTHQPSSDIESVCEEARLGGPSRLGSRGDWSGAISRGERSGVNSRQKNATPDNPPGLRLHRSTTQLPDIRDTTPRPGAVSASGRILTTPSSARMNSSRMGSPTRNTSPRRKPESARLPTTRKLGAVAESRPVSHQAVNQSKEGVAATPNAPPTSPELRPKEKAPRRTKSYRTDMLLKNYMQGPPVNYLNADEWLMNTTPEEKQIMMKALTATDRGVIDKDDSGIQKWLETATEKEREVAQDFFHSLTSQPRLGQGVDQQERLRHIANLLARGGQCGVYSTPGAGSGESTFQTSNLRYVRLLTPNTRASKWLHRSWHHLPPANDNNPVNNPSAMYTMPGKPSPRHYVIHPDWG